MKSIVKRLLAGSLICYSILLLQIGCSRQPSQQANQTNLATSTSPTPSPAADTASPGSIPTSSPALAAAEKGATGSTSTPAETPRPPRVVTLGAGTPIPIWTSSTLSTKTHQAGASFVGSLARPIVDGDWVIAKKGARVEGVIAEADKGGRVKGRASITVRLKSLALADGRMLDISTSSYTKEAKSTKKKDALKIGIGAGIGAVIGAIAGGGKGAAIGAGAGGAGGTGLVLATRGDPAVIPSESQLNFRLASPVQVTQR